MKKNDEIRGLPHLIIFGTGEDGGAGRIMLGKLDGTVIWSWGLGWDHVSVAPRKRNYTPTWDDMCKLKDMFFYPEEAVVQYHPPQSLYVNNVENCLHLWRPQSADLPLPPTFLIGKPRHSETTKQEAEK